MTDFIPNYVSAGIKTRNDAITHIFDCLSKNPGCAGLDGTLTICYGGEVFNMSIAKKKSKKDEE